MEKKVDERFDVLQMRLNMLREEYHDTPALREQVKWTSYYLPGREHYMVRKLDPADFRAHRLVLDPDDFGLYEPFPEPTNIVSADVWKGIMTLPSDVAVTTTDYEGTEVGNMYGFWSEWIHIMHIISTKPNITLQAAILTDGMYHTSDEFAASLFNLLQEIHSKILPGKASLKLMSSARARSSIGRRTTLQ